MGKSKYQLIIDSLRQTIEEIARSIWLVGEARLGRPAQRLWANPLLRHVRHERPLPWFVIRRWSVTAIIVVILLSGLAWVFNWRLLGALLIGASLGVILFLGLAAPVLGADRVARQMRFARYDPRRLTDLDPRVVVCGLALVTLWHLRWLIVAGIVMTPALVIGMMRLDVANFTVWRESVEALGAAAPAGASNWLPSDGHIPYFRLALRALSAGGLPWVMLPLLASLGITSALLLRDASLSPLVGLLGAILLSGVISFVWEGLTRTPLLAGGLEVVRLVLLIGLLVGIGRGVIWVNGKNGACLAHLQVAVCEQTNIKVGQTGKDSK
ncbi:MAG: hypothetical protein JXB07_18030 [Anaerolineae bacterium]|nr:hypothetical protein [Anaerolineae bacterium]